MPRVAALGVDVASGSLREVFLGWFPVLESECRVSAGLGRGEAMVGASRAGVDPRTTRVAWGVQLLVGGGHGVLSLVTRASHLKVAGGGSWRFWGLEKSVKVLRKSLLQAVFFGFGIAGGIDGMRWEMISRNLGAISRVSYSSCARFGGRG